MPHYAVKNYSTDLFERFNINSKAALIKLGQGRGLDRMGPPVAVGK